jgi:hypothetical protein
VTTHRIGPAGRCPRSLFDRSTRRQPRRQPPADRQGASSRHIATGAVTLAAVRRTPSRTSLRRFRRGLSVALLRRFSHHRYGTQDLRIAAGDEARSPQRTPALRCGTARTATASRATAHRGHRACGHRAAGRIPLAPTSGHNSARPRPPHRGLPTSSVRHARPGPVARVHAAACTTSHSVTMASSRASVASLGSRSSSCAA